MLAKRLQRNITEKSGRSAKDNNEAENLGPTCQIFIIREDYIEIWNEEWRGDFNVGCTPDELHMIHGHFLKDSQVLLSSSKLINPHRYIHIQIQICYPPPTKRLHKISCVYAGLEKGRTPRSVMDSLI